MHVSLFTVLINQIINLTMASNGICVYVKTTHNSLMMHILGAVCPYNKLNT